MIVNLRIFDCGDGGWGYVFYEKKFLGVIFSNEM